MLLEGSKKSLWNPIITCDDLDFQDFKRSYTVIFQNFLFWHYERTKLSQKLLSKSLNLLWLAGLAMPIGYGQMNFIFSHSSLRERLEIRDEQSQCADHLEVLLVSC